MLLILEEISLILQEQQNCPIFQLVGEDFLQMSRYAVILTACVKSVITQSCKDKILEFLPIWILLKKWRNCLSVIRTKTITVDFVVHLNHENKNPTKYNFLIDCCLVFGTTNSRTDGSMDFVETTKIGVNE